MEELVSMFSTERGITLLSPEQTVALLRCFMNDEKPSETARRTGLSIPEAEQCTSDLWNLFSWRKEMLHAG